MAGDSVFELDARWSQRLRIAEQPGILRSLAVFFAHSADSWFDGIALAIVWWLGDADWKRWVLQMLLAMVIMMLLTGILKLSFRRRRPEGTWGGIYRTTDPHSFPSGHAARSALFAVLITAWGPTWLAPIAILWAPLVALARVALGVHYLSDVIVGAGFGIVVAVGVSAFLF
ncbi:MAG TPA: phosphatase PAP2 family protein [Anaerolineae bacterium]|nr:phosphatase PAP2 family protein [Anaerolineae bacterium]